MKRYLESLIKEDLKKKMVFLGGPRQTGKTTLAKALLKNKKNYLSWDLDEDRTAILQKEFPQQGLLVFDELHKYRKWRGYLKGLYDKRNPDFQILVTGSARLDYYRYGGDSLQGRYHYWRLHPLSLAELKSSSQNDLHDLLTLGGFPEPFLSGSQREAKRWSREYKARIVRDDLSSIENVSDLASIEILFNHLPHTVGSPLSINSLREQLLVSHQTTAKWLDILERLYGFFRISPFGPAMIRAVKKEQKHYLFDWSAITDEGARFENMIAVHLQKHIHYLQDAEGEDIALRYYRDTTPREVDFIIVKNNKPIQAIECKLSDTNVSSSLRYFKSKFPECQCIQITLQDQKNFISKDGIQVMPARKYLADLT
jgi:predicted AAA+ superfamily ATPase